MTITMMMKMKTKMIMNLNKLRIPAVNFVCIVQKPRFRIRMGKSTKTVVPTSLPPSDTKALTSNTVAIMNSNAIGGSAHSSPFTVADLLALWLRVVRQTDGRDKGLKVVQYTVKLILLTVLRGDRLKKLHPLTVKRFGNLASAFSTARKIIRLGHAAEPYSELHPVLSQLQALLYAWYVTGKRPQLTQIQKQKITSPDNVLSVLNQSLSVLNDFSDDIVCLSKIGVLVPATGKRFEPISNWLWLSCIGLDLYDQGRAYLILESKYRTAMKEAPLVDNKEAKISLQQLKEKRLLMQVSLVKLLADLGFCTYDVMESQFSDTFQASCGWIAGLLGFYKLWLKASSK